jgi:2'-5' RNA ligase
MDTACVVVVMPPSRILKELDILMGELNSDYKTSYTIPFAHVTLKSMGVVSDDKCIAAIKEVYKIAAETRPFTMDIGDIRYFGSNEDHPGVFLSIDKSKEALGLHTRLAAALKAYSDSEDRSYKELDCWNPHITLALIDEKEELERAKADIGRKFYPGRFRDAFRVIDLIFLTYKKDGPKRWYLANKIELKRLY